MIQFDQTVMVRERQFGLLPQLHEAEDGHLNLASRADAVQGAHSSDTNSDRQICDLSSAGVFALPLAKVHPAAAGPRHLALAWCAFVAAATCLLALLALPISCYRRCEGLEVASGGHDCWSWFCHELDALSARLEAGAYNANNLALMSRFRNRVGWNLAFLEDNLMQGLLLGRGKRGQQQRIKAAALQEFQDQMNREMAEKDRLRAARALIGPHGGLRNLKDDITQLAQLLHVEVRPKDTIALLQNKAKPIVETIKQSAPEAKEQSCSESIEPSHRLPREALRQSP